MKQFLAIILTLLLMPAMVLFAQEEPPIDVIVEEETTAETTSETDGRIVVTATRQKRAVMDTPVPSDVITREDIEKKVPMSTGDLVKNRPGMNLSQSGMGTNRPMIRGLYDARVLILVDGIKLSEQRPGGNHALSIDPSMVERVEIVRGPSSVLYGSDALGGVINFISRKPKDRISDTPWLDGSAEASYDSATNGKIATAHINGGINRFNYHAGGSWKETDNVDTPKGELKFSEHDAWNYSGGVGYAMEKSSITMNYLGSYSTIGVPVGNAQAFNKFQFEGERHDALMTTWRAWDMSEMWTDLQLQVAYQDHARRMRKEKTDGTKAGINIDFNTWNVNGMTTLIPMKNHRLTTGFQTLLEQEETENPYTGATAVAPPSRRIGVGTFLQDEITVTKSTEIITGIRYDFFQSHTDGADDHAVTDEVTKNTQSVSATAGVLYRIIPHRLHGAFNVGRAFRSPTLHEQFFRGPHQDTYDIGNPDLKPEYSYNTDVSLKFFHERVRGQVSGFVNYIDQYIDKRLTGGTHGSYNDAEFKNIGEAMLYGGEGDLEVSVYRGIALYGLVNYVRGRNLSDEVNLFSMPPLSGTYGLRYNSNAAKELSWWSELGFRWAAKQWEPGKNPETGAEEDKTPGWQVMDISAGINWKKTLSSTFFIKNVFDLAYHDHLSRINETNSPEVDGKEQPGRSIGFMTTYRF